MGMRPDLQLSSGARGQREAGAEGDPARAIQTVASRSLRWRSVSSVGPCTKYGCVPRETTRPCLVI
jgi:hypothetical protein